MKVKINKTIILIITITLMLSTLTACEEKTTVETTEKEKNNSLLTENIMNNIDSWGTISDDFTKQYTYDEIPATMFYLYSAGIQGKYYFGASYGMPSDGVHGMTIYHKIFSVTETTFKFIYGNEYSANDPTVRDCKLLSAQVASSKDADKREYIEKLVLDGLTAEEKYFKEINLNSTDTIELSSEQTALFNNMYTAILELEKNQDRGPLAKIKYYDLGNGSCEVLFYYGGTNEYVTAAAYVIIGYSIGQDGYERLSNTAENRLKNTTNIKTLKWNVDWTSEKKEYELKQSIQLTNGK